jgi:hypothetical protein
MRIAWFFRAWRPAGWRYAMKRPNHGTEIVFDPESEEGVS